MNGKSHKTCEITFEKDNTILEEFITKVFFGVILYKYFCIVFFNSQEIENTIPII